MSDRFIVAREMAVKDKRDWDKLDPIMVNAYLHAADTDIETRALAPVIVDGVEVKFSCKVCDDKAYRDNKPCPECNPIGLPAEKVYPGAEVMTTAVAIGDINLCDTCTLEFGACDSPDVEYGNGKGNDNVIKCAIHSPADNAADEKARLELEARQTEEGKEAIRQNRELKPNEYRCSKCSKPGKTVIHMLKKGGTGIGHKHREFRVA